MSSLELGSVGGPGLVRLNVGGHWYTTTRNTLLAHPHSLFHTMLSNDTHGNHNGFLDNHDSNKQDPTLNSGYYFIDRDGQLFRHILNYLRSGELRCPADFKEYEQLLQEARFYCLDKLEAEINHISHPDYHVIEVIEIAHPEKLGLCCTRVVLSPAAAKVAPIDQVLKEGKGETVEGPRGRFWVRTSIGRLEWGERLRSHGWTYCGNVAIIRKIPDITGHGTDMTHVVEKWEKLK